MTKEELQKELNSYKEQLELALQDNKRLKDLLQQLSSSLSGSILGHMKSLFTSVQQDRPKDAVIKETILDNPFVKQTMETVERIQKRFEPKSKASEWKKYDKFIIRASKEDTPNSQRTLEYLANKLPFSKKAISRHIYRLGFKWKNGKVTCA
jgi:hypothetical protein